MIDILSSEDLLGPQRASGVLVADDESEIREALDSGLPHWGFAVWLAVDGQEALDLYRGNSEAIQVVLLDLHMPRLDGPRTLSALQELRPNIPCCFMSGNLGKYREDELRKQGARSILQKPFRVHDAARVLRSIVDGVDSRPDGVAVGCESPLRPCAADGSEQRVSE